MKRITATVAATVLAGALVAAWTTPVFANAPSAGFPGQWATFECAQWWEEPHVVDCDRWGDGSTITLGIGRGRTPAAVYQDTYSSWCSLSGSANTRWVATGSGEYEGTDTLWLNFTRSGCGALATDGFTIQLYHDAGSDTLWEDEDGDGWGLVWHRVP